LDRYLRWYEPEGQADIGQRRVLGHNGK
jgi:hypothetical protein